MNYTERLKKELERVTLKGNADKETIRILAAIIFDMEQRLLAVEGNESSTPTVEVQKVVEEVVEEPVSTTKKVGGTRNTKTTG